MNITNMESLLRRFGATLADERLFDEHCTNEVRMLLEIVDTPSEQPQEWGSMRQQCLKRRIGLVAQNAIAASIALTLWGFWRASPEYPPIREPALAMRTDWASDRADLFRTQRSGDDVPQNICVGVQVDQDAVIRLLAVCEPPFIESLPLSRTGEKSVRIAAGGSLSFGAYERTANDVAGHSSVIRKIMVVASRRDIDQLTFEQIVTTSGERDLQRLTERVMDDLHARFDCRIEMIDLARPR